MKVIKSWFDIRSKPPGMLAFSLHRLTGIGLLGYLYLHLALLSLLRQGADGWDGFVRIMHSPWVSGLEAILLFGMLMHGLNGLRLFFIGLGIGLRWQRTGFWLCLILSLALTAWGFLKMR